MSNNINNKTLGILGGGQLGRMLIQSALNFNLDVAVLDPDPDASCRDVAARFVVGDFKDEKTVLEFGRDVDVITIEIENVNVAALKALRDQGKRIYPAPEIIEIIQDKGTQKAFLKNHGLPTADFVLIQTKSEIEKHAAFLPVVQKLRVAGYDGRGVCKIESSDKIDDAFNAPSVLEKLIDFDKEIAVIVARNESGEIKTHPAVEMIFHPTAHLVEFLSCPAQLSVHIATKAKDLAVRAAQALNLVGLLAVEMFVTKDGDVLINEMAPRPHNSGHHTIEACATSQFEQHLRAIFDLPLGATEARVPAVMVNVLGEMGHNGVARYDGLEKILALPGVSLHLYGKKLTKPFRKMGHVTVTDVNPDLALATARKVKNLLKVVT